MLEFSVVLPVPHPYCLHHLWPYILMKTFSAFSDILSWRALFHLLSLHMWQPKSSVPFISSWRITQDKACVFVPWLTSLTRVLWAILHCWLGDRNGIHLWKNVLQLSPEILLWDVQPEQNWMCMCVCVCVLEFDYSDNEQVQDSCFYSIYKTGSSLI